MGVEERNDASEDEAYEEERLARHEQSDVDAMGLDKRRQVVGGQYGASVAQAGDALRCRACDRRRARDRLHPARDELDKAPETVESQAPWSEPRTADTPPSPLE